MKSDKYMDSENSKTSDFHRLLRSLSDKINLKSTNKNVALSNLSTYYSWKHMKKSYKNNKFKMSIGLKKLNYLMDYIVYEIFKITLKISLRKHETVTNNPSIVICVNKI